MDITDIKPTEAVSGDAKNLGGTLAEAKPSLASLREKLIDKTAGRFGKTVDRTATKFKTILQKGKKLAGK